MPVQLDSSAISQVEYDSSSRTLRVWFTSGKVYDYYGVPQDIYEGLISAPSAGKFFNDHIRDQYSIR